MPLKIALVGAPNSGKTELAQQIQQALPERSLQIVDKYVEDLQKHTGLAFDHYANFHGNAMIALRRVEEELNRTSVLNPDGGLEVLVTCGSAIETTVYSAFFALSNSKTGNPGVNAMNDKRTFTAMTWLGTLAHDTWDYDYAFYVPYDGKDDWQLIVDEHIAEAAESLGVKLIDLPLARDLRLAKVEETLQNVDWEKVVDSSTSTEE